MCLSLKSEECGYLGGYQSLKISCYSLFKFSLRAEMKGIEMFFSNETCIYRGNSTRNDLLYLYKLGPSGLYSLKLGIVEAEDEHFGKEREYLELVHVAGLAAGNRLHHLEYCTHTHRTIALHIIALLYIYTTMYKCSRYFQMSTGP